MAATVNGVGSARAYFSRDTAEIARVEISTVGDSTLGVDEIRYGFGDLLTPTTFATFRDLDGARFDDTFQTLAGTFEGTGAGNLAFDPNDFTIDDFGFFGDSTGPIATRETTLAIENNLFAFLAAGEEITAVLPTLYADGQSQTADAVFEYTFVGVNDAPTAVDDSAVTDEDTAIAVNFLSNDFDIDGGPFLIDAINGTSVSGTTFELPSGATIRFDDSGDIVYDPTGSATLQSLGAGQSFTDLFTYTIRDFGGLAASGTVDIRVSGLDDAAVGTANLISQFDPSGSGSLYSMSVSANSAEIAVVAQSSSTIDIYTPQGVFLRSLTLPGDIGNDGDLDFVPESFDLAGVTIPRGALLVMSGDSAEAEVFAIDPSDGEVLSTLNTVVGNSFTVGMAYNPVTATLFLLTCNCDSDGNVIVEVDPATGQELSRIELDPLNFQTFFGDLDVDPTTGDLIVVSSASTEILRLSSQGTVLERVDLPATVDGLSGVSVVRGDPLDIFVSSTSGSVFRLAEGVGANLGAVAVADLAQTDEATPVEIDIGANDTDPEGDALSFELVSSNGDGSADAVLDFVFTGTAPLPDTEALFDGDTGTFVSLPTGSSITVAFADEIVVDGQGDDFRIVEEFNAESARVEISADGITFLDIGVIDGTTAFDLADFGFSDRLFAVRITGLDDGGTFPFEGFDLVSVDAIGSFSAAPQGLVSEVDEGLVSYDPNGQFDDLNDGETRRDFFTYQVTDGGGEVSFAPVSVTVSGIGQSVITTGVDVLLSDDGLPVPISFDALLANDSDSDGDPLTIQSIATTSAFGAPITVSGNGASYDPGSFYDVISFGQQLTDTFTYVATDGDGNTAQGTVFVTLSGTNDPVTAVADVGSPGTGFTIDSPTSTGTPTGDGIGRSVASAGDVNGDGIGDLITGAPLATRGVTEGSGVAFVVFGSASTAPDVLDLSDIDDGGGFSITGLSENDALGTSVAGISDLNGDGTDDIAVSAPEAGTGGETYVIFGDESGFDPSFDLATLSGLNGFVFAGDNAFGQSGFSVAGAGDINGDGSDDLIIGAPLAGSGESYVIFGSDSGFPARLTPGDLTGANGFVISSSSGSSNAGVSVASAGDFNADGVDDLFIGASALDVGNAVAVGGGFILFGSTNGFGAEVSLETLTQGTGVTIQGFQPESEAGLSVAGIGDFNGDDVDDVIIGAPGTTTGNGIVSGQSYVLFGAGTGLPGTIDLQALSGDDGFAISGLAAEDAAGLAVTGVGDVNGDGLDDIVVTAPGADPSGQVAAGSAYLIFGAESGFGGDLDLSGLNGRNGYVLEGFDALGTVGVSVSAAGDMNGDGIGDLMLGAPGADLLNRSSGQVYVVFGGLGLRVADGDADGVISLAGLFPGLKPNLITTEDTPLSILGDDLTANDLDADALDNLVVTGVDSVSANGATVSLDGQTITYDPSGAFDELDFGDLSVDTFSYTVSDPAGETDTALVAVVIAGEDDLFQTLSLPAPAVLDPGLTGLGLSAFATTALPADTPDTTAPDGVLKITGGSYSTLTLQMATWRANSDDIMPAEMGAVDLKVSLPFGGEVMFSNAFDAASVSESYRISPDAGVLNVDYTLEDVQRAIVASQPSDGDDQIIGTTGNDTLTGDFAGADVLSGLSGDDFYDIAMGSGWLVIDDVTAGGADTVRIAGLNSTEAVFGRSAGFSDDLIIDNGAGGQVMILNSLSDNFVGGVETVILDDATLSMGDLRALLLDQAATGGDDAIFGFATDDTITGGRGDDSLFGGDGSDRFVFAIGDGRDIIEDTGTGASDQDALVLEGRVFTEAAFSLTDATLGTLEIDFENGDQVTIVSGIGENAMVESIVFEDMIISSSVLDSLF
ncbi:MAG: Ig-like domain-containing protein [Pseudomonadota bacterium]